MIDENVKDIDFTDIPDIVGITGMTAVINRAYEIADIYRQKGAKVILGGIHVSMLPEEALQHADTVVVGEVENVWQNLINDLTGGQLKRLYKGTTEIPLNGLGFVRRDLINKKSYSMPSPIMTSRGCPHNCTYCSVTEFWGHHFRHRPIDDIITEIKAINDKWIAFVDDNIYGDIKHSKELFRRMKPLGVKWVGQGDMRIARNPELLELARESGCEWLFIGIETISTENLKSIHKSFNMGDKYKEAIATIKSSGIKVFGSFIFGLENDDEGIFERTVKFGIENKLDGANFYILTPFPGTELFEQMEKQGLLLHKDWSKYDANHVVFRHKKLIKKQLEDGLIYAYKRFYSIPSIMKRVVYPRKDLLQVLALNTMRHLSTNRFTRGVRT
ncbi:MAG: B12-binding domain-containing radical SAM protein [Deltaproteobacteria bacterium]|nr:B12-binding domain-containing radical SAM protein [Deltaproteobacteria bacterium]MCL5878388.1 B12-binding domain-containing radical SAM protein [Deltaproteobacteria bacterium]